MDSLIQGMLAMLSKKSNTYSRFAGFSLIELIIALAVLATLVAVAAPYVTSVMANNRVEAETNRLVSALNVARTTALKFKRRAGLCRSASATSCGGAGDWATTGWLVYQDADDDSVLDGGEEVRWFQAISRDTTITSSEPDQVLFDSRGYLETAGAPTFTLKAPKCDSIGGRVITIGASGASKISKVSC